jgi:hypothetical protein
VPSNSLRELIEEVGVGGICDEGLFNDLERGPLLLQLLDLHHPLAPLLHPHGPVLPASSSCYPTNAAYIPAYHQAAARDRRWWWSRALSMQVAS